MNVKLLHITQLSTLVESIRICYDSLSKSDSFFPDDTPYPYFQLGAKDKHLIQECIKLGHHVPLEMINFTFKVEGLSRACMLELEKHRLTSITAKSSRYTLKKDLRNESSFIGYFDGQFEYDFEKASKYVVLTGNEAVDKEIVHSLEGLMELTKLGIPNDVLKYAVLDCYKIDFIMNINCRSWRNMVKQRSDKKALWEFQDFIKETTQIIPYGYHFLFEDCIQN